MAPVGVRGAVADVHGVGGPERQRLVERDRQAGSAPARPERGAGTTARAASTDPVSMSRSNSSPDRGVRRHAAGPAGRIHRRHDRRPDGLELERPGRVGRGVAGEVGEAGGDGDAERGRRWELPGRGEDDRRVAVPGEGPADVRLDPEALLDGRPVDRLAEGQVDRGQRLGDVIVVGGGRAERHPGQRRGTAIDEGRVVEDERQRGDCGDRQEARDPASGHRLTARGERGSRGRTIAQHLYCRTCEPAPLRVSLRGRRDTGLDPRHLPRHPELRRPAVPGPAAVDGAHARAGAVRPGRQADPPLR